MKIPWMESFSAPWPKNIRKKLAKGGADWILNYLQQHPEEKFATQYSAGSLVVGFRLDDGTIRLFDTTLHREATIDAASVRASE